MYLQFAPFCPLLIYRQAKAIHSFSPFLSQCPFFELSALDRSHFLGSFSLTMFIRMFLNFNNENLITLKLDTADDKTMITVLHE